MDGAEQNRFEGETRGLAARELEFTIPGHKRLPQFAAYRRERKILGEAFRQVSESKARPYGQIQRRSLGEKPCGLSRNL